MAELSEVPWPPDPIATTRLLLRRTEPRDRQGYVELRCSRDVWRYLGGPMAREEVEQVVPAAPGDRPGVFTAEVGGGLIGTVTVDRRDRGRPGRLRAQGGDLEVSYLFLPEFWGRGYATEAVTGVLAWVDRVLPGEPVVLCTQSANQASVRLAERVGFVEQERFVEFGAEQWFGVRPPPGQADGSTTAARACR
jgi:RimJ/RimL family protein N-acetyltransferase